MFPVVLPIYIILFVVLFMVVLYSNYLYFKKNQMLESENGELKFSCDECVKDRRMFKSKIIELSNELNNKEKIINSNKELIEKLYVQNRELMGLSKNEMEILPDSETQATLFDGIKH